MKNETVYHCPDNIKNFKISVTFDGETRYFGWQQKIYSKFERDFYKDEKNCLTDLERKYHRDVVKMLESDGVLFSYTHEDRFLPPDEFFGVEEPCEVMYIMADLGDYADDVWIKNEHVLCTIRYDCERNILWMNPDFSATKPYTLTVDAAKTYFYSIENACESIDGDWLQKEEELALKLIGEKIKKRAEIIGERFDSTSKTVIYLFFEIAHARDFENDHIYIRYLIDLPKNYTCADLSTLTGTTQTSKTTPNHFGFCFDVVLQLEGDTVDHRLPYIYFEVVSKDTWSRFRSEGLAYQCLPVLKSGHSEFQLSCVRICPVGAAGELRRFFIGDCGGYSDITWVGLPKDYEGAAINKFGVKTIATGELTVKLSVVQQKTATLGDESPQRDVFSEKFQSSTLLKSVAEVVRAFKKARKNMIETRKNL